MGALKGTVPAHASPVLGPSFGASNLFGVELDAPGKPPSPTRRKPHRLGGPSFPPGVSRACRSGGLDNDC
jgi:hypothetical protein